MAATSVTTAAPGQPAAPTREYVQPRTSRGLYRDAWRRLLKNKLAVAGMITIVILLVMAILAPILAPYDPNRLFPGQSYVRPNAEHWMGTDDVGRDVLSRLLWGARVSLAVGIL